MNNRVNPRPGSGPAPTPDLPLLPSTRQRVLSALVSEADEGRGTPTIEGLTARLGGHPNTTRTQLEALVRDGLAYRLRRTTGSRGRPAMTYTPTLAGREAHAHSRGPGPVTAQYAEVLRAMAAQLTDAERSGAAARRAGRRWGTAILKRHPGNLSARADPVEVAAELLAAQGFGPRIVGRPDRYDGGDRYEPYDGGYRYDRGEAGAADREIVLRTCPFLELAAEQPDVMCQLHQGMLAEVLAATGATARLIPFADEWGCRVLIDAVSQDRTGSPPGLLERDRHDHSPPSVEGGAHCAQKPRDPPYQSP